MGILRLLLAISVVTAHNGPILGTTFIGGTMAVETFFIISGFYMALVWNEKYFTSKNSYLLFISNRFLRIYPLYLVVFSLLFLFSAYWFFTGVGSQLSIYKQYIHILNPLTLLFLIFSNVFIFGQDVALFLGLNENTGNVFFTENFTKVNPSLISFMFFPQGWTLSIELLFYLIAPFLVRRKAMTIFALITFTLMLRIMLYTIGLDHEPWTYRFFPTELLFFLLGIISYKIYKHTNPKMVNKRIIFFIYLMFLLFIIFYEKIPVVMYTWFNVPQWIYYFLFAIFVPFIFLVFKSNKLDRFLGELSYPVYISHLFIGTLLIQYNIGRFANNAYYSLFSVIGSIIFSYILIKLIDLPLERYRQRRIKQQK